MKPAPLTLTVLPLLVSLLCPGAVRAGGTDDDVGLWLMTLAQGSWKSVSPKLENYLWWLDNHARFMDDSDGFDVSIVRPGLGYSLMDNLSGSGKGREWQLAAAKSIRQLRGRYFP